jgi:hypothetical protein
VRNGCARPAFPLFVASIVSFLWYDYPIQSSIQCNTMSSAVLSCHKFMAAWLTPNCHVLTVVITVEESNTIQTANFWHQNVTCRVVHVTKIMDLLVLQLQVLLTTLNTVLSLIYIIYNSLLHHCTGVASWQRISPHELVLQITAKCSCYFAFNRSLLLCPYLYSLFTVH